MIAPLVRISMISRYIWKCLLKGTNPWKYFQLNAEYFNEEKGIFSKVEIDQHIPEKWRLKLWELPKSGDPSSWKSEILSRFDFPFFLKPEWGQNSHGIFRINSESDLDKALQSIDTGIIPYFCQAAGTGSKEIDIFFIRSPENPRQLSMLSLTESQHAQGEKFPILSILNDTKYQDLTPLLSNEQQQELSKICTSIGKFNMGRIGTKCDSLEELCNGNFKIIEINIYLPLPISLCDPNMSDEDQEFFLEAFTEELATAASKLPKKKHKNIFWNKTLTHYKIKKKTPFTKPSA